MRGGTPYQQLAALSAAVMLALLCPGSAHAAERNVWSIGRVSTAAPVDSNGQVLLAGAGVGISSPSSLPCNGTILGVYAANPPIMDLPFVEQDFIPHAYGLMLGGQCILAEKNSRMEFYLSESVGILGTVQDGKRTVLPLTEIGVGARTTLRSRDGLGTLYVSPELGFIPILFSPYFSLSMGWKA